MQGSYNQWTPGGPWYYYAMGYGTCKQGGDMCHGCGYGYSWIGVWKSADSELLLPNPIAAHEDVTLTA